MRTQIILWLSALLIWTVTQFTGPIYLGSVGLSVTFFVDGTAGIDISSSITRFDPYEFYFPYILLPIGALFHLIRRWMQKPSRVHMIYLKGG